MRKYIKTVDFMSTKSITIKITPLYIPLYIYEYEIKWTWSSRSRPYFINDTWKRLDEPLVIYHIYACQRYMYVVSITNPVLQSTSVNFQRIEAFKFSGFIYELIKDLISWVYCTILFLLQTISEKVWLKFLLNCIWHKTTYEGPLHGKHVFILIIQQYSKWCIYLGRGVYLY